MRSLRLRGSQTSPGRSEGGRFRCRIILTALDIEPRFRAGDAGNKANSRVGVHFLHTSCAIYGEFELPGKNCYNRIVSDSLVPPMAPITVAAQSHLRCGAQTTIAADSISIYKKSKRMPGDAVFEAGRNSDRTRWRALDEDVIR